MLPGYVIVVMVIRICCYGYQVEDFLSVLNAFWELARSFVAGFTSYFLRSYIFIVRSYLQSTSFNVGFCKR